MSLRFPYGSKQIEEGVIPDPIATLTVKTIVGNRNFDFLVDSGADTTTIPIIWSYLFGFNKKNSKKTWVGGVEGGKIEAYMSTVEIKFDKAFYKIRVLFVNSNVTPLLGRLDIWEKFSLFFDNKRKETVFYKI